MLKRNIMTRFTIVLMAAVVVLVTMTGCGMGEAATDRTPYTTRYDDSADADPDTVADAEPEETDVYPETVETETPAETIEVFNAETDITTEPMNSVDAIAEIGDLVGNYSLYATLHTAIVDIDEDHNPYDLTWAYGEEPANSLTTSKKQELVMAPEWGALYNAYVDACDWSLVFDIDYYMAQFPVLAYSYQYDEDLLLEHFQTTGVHEGRQGSADFNVAAYMQNCSQELKDTFEDNYECYYFYFMLNQDTEHDAVTTGSNNPVYLSVQLSYYQNEEYEHVNDYREEVGADPVVVDPEMMAFANLRSWYDAKYAIRAHDSITEGWVADCMRTMGLLHYAENNCKDHTCRTGSDLTTPYIRYRYSDGHYEAMVNPDYVYAGFSNCYFSAYTAKTAVQYDLYTGYTPNTSR